MRTTRSNFARRHRDKIRFAMMIAFAFVLSYIYAYAMQQEKQADLKAFNCIQLDFKGSVDHPKHIEMTVTTNKKGHERLLATADGRKQLIEEYAPFDFNYDDIETIYLLPNACDANPSINPVNEG
ncbi:hypothetical protein [uncultured Psychrobacter sp.]|uniref:hypothetical protein n=1 Tax=uncultured Psychrobacter sp. TaxID=259303 RepID=UPI0030DAFBF4